MRYAYPVDIELDEEGRHVVRFPDIPGAVTDGATREEALDEAADCLDMALATRMHEGEDIPAASPAAGRPRIAVELTTAAKVALCERMREIDIKNVELARRLKVNERVVRRMLDPLHKTKTECLLRALHVLGVRLEVHSVKTERAA